MYKKLRWSFSLLLCITIALMNPLSSMAAQEKEADNTLIISSIEREEQKFTCEKEASTV